MRVRSLLKHQLSVYKNEILLLIIGNIIGGLVVSFFNVSIFVEVALVGLLGYFSINFVRTSSIFPNVNGDANRFNWKYFQNLPLEKTEVLLFASTSFFLVSLPMMVWILSFLPSLYDVVSGSGEKSLSFMFYFKTFTLLISLVAFTSISSIGALIAKPRIDMQKVNLKTKALLGLKSMLLVATISIYLYFLVNLVSQNETLATIMAALLSPLLIIEYLGFFFVPILLVGLTLLFAKLAMDSWNHEQRSYKSFNWDQKKDGRTVFVCVLLIGISASSRSFFIPSPYRGNDLHHAVYLNDKGLMKELLNKEPSMANEENRSNLLPLHIAIKMGNLGAYEILKPKTKLIVDRKAKYIEKNDLLYMAIKSNNFKLYKKIENDFKFNIYAKTEKMGNSYVHHAALSCRPEIIDHMFVHWDVDVNVKNNKKQRPSHFAAMKGCVSTLATMYEKGAQFHLVDEKGKSVLDYASALKKGKYQNRKKISDVTYFIKSRTREPASVKK